MATMLCTIYQTLCNGSIGVHQVCKLGLQSCFLQNKKKKTGIQEASGLLPEHLTATAILPSKNNPPLVAFQGVLGIATPKKKEP